MSDTTRFPGSDRAILLRDGRLLGYAEYGDPDGKPVLYFHGWPSSRLEGRLLHDAARTAGARLIAIDRPGIGLSEPKQGITLLAWPDDVTELVDALGLDRFAILAVSSGAPWALACGYRIPSRLSTIGLVAATGPFEEPIARKALDPVERVLHQVALRAPLLLRAVFTAAAFPIRRDARGLVSAMVLRQPAPDRPLLQRPEVGETVAAALREALRNGPAGLVGGAAVQARPWGFRLTEVTSKVLLWHGERDETVSPEATRHLAAMLPSAAATFLPEAAHLGALIGHAPAILRALVDETARARPAA